MFDRFGNFSYWPIPIFGKKLVSSGFSRNVKYQLFWAADIILEIAEITDYRQAPVIDHTLLRAIIASTLINIQLLYVN